MLRRKMLSANLQVDPTADAIEVAAQTVAVPETDTAALAMQLVIPVMLVGNEGRLHLSCTLVHSD